MAQEQNTFPHELLGRKIWFKYPERTQILMLERFRMQAKAAARLEDDKQAVPAILSVTMKTLNVIDALFIDPDDRDWVEEQMVAGKIQAEDLFPVLSGGKVSKEPADDADPAPKKAAGRKAPARKAAKPAGTMTPTKKTAARRAAK